MPTGLSLHLGLNGVDPKHYSGWSGPLAACEADAKDMQTLAKKAGFRPTVLLTPKCTRKAVLAALKAAAGALKKDDIFFLTYSGHGGQVYNTGSDFEPDGFDETWCLHDGQLIDDELYGTLGTFAAGVRIFVLSDSCHSGTVLRDAHFAALGLAPVRPRAMPRDIALRVYMDNAEFYDALQPKAGKADARKAIKATGLLISGCQDNQTSSDGERNGLFTATLLAVWKNGKFQGGYRDFHKTILKFMPPVQTPNYFTVGPANHAFEAQKPFTI